ncbi:RagB/SusD family nutrient uptake outer membrane protein [Larkinella arboricola]
MKKILSIVCCLLTGTAFIQSCKNDELLNLQNPQAYNPSEVWRDQNLANAYLVDIYASLPGWPVNQGDYADESANVLGPDYVTTSNNNFKYWPYNTIRKINILLTEIDGGTLPEAFKNSLKGQAHFLRAFHYFKAVVYHGGVPILDKPQLLTDSLSVARNSTAECFAFILQDLDNAIKMLPDKYTGADFGRMDKAAATAFKGRVMLYKASPQFNPANPYSNSYWADAYTTNKTAREFLEGLGYGLYPDYAGIWMNEGNREDIMTVIYQNPGKINGRMEHCIRPLGQSKDCTGADNPVWDLVSQYPMKDGKQPGTSTKYPYNVQTFWQNRDPRFDATIAYNGSIFPLGVRADYRQYTDLQLGGLVDGFGPGQQFNRSGFYTRKGVDNSLSQAQVALNAVDWVEIRFAEVLLNFAEAANETGHPDEALAVLKQIRQRAGIEAGTDGLYGLKNGMTRLEMRDAIYQERFIEFAFEGKRFWDMRRLRRMSELNGKAKSGLQAQLKPGLDPNDRSKVFVPTDFTYTVRELIINGPRQMVLPESYYFFPIAQGEIEKNPRLKQNKDWGGTFDPTLQ